MRFSKITVALLQLLAVSTVGVKDGRQHISIAVKEMSIEETDFLARVHKDILDPPKPLGELLLSALHYFLFSPQESRTGIAGQTKEGTSISRDNPLEEARGQTVSTGLQNTETSFIPENRVASRKDVSKGHRSRPARQRHDSGDIDHPQSGHGRESAEQDQQLSTTGQNHGDNSTVPEVSAALNNDGPATPHRSNKRKRDVQSFDDIIIWGWKVCTIQHIRPSC
jgi:hypothetical protein